MAKAAGVQSQRSETLAPTNTLAGRLWSGLGRIGAGLLSGVASIVSYFAGDNEEAAKAAVSTASSDETPSRPATPPSSIEYSPSPQQETAVIPRNKTAFRSPNRNTHPQKSDEQRRWKKEWMDHRVGSLIDAAFSPSQSLKQRKRALEIIYDALEETTYPKFIARDSYSNEEEFKRNMVGALTKIYQRDPDEFEQFNRAVLSLQPYKSKQHREWEKVWAQYSWEKEWMDHQVGSLIDAAFSPSQPLPQRRHALRIINTALEGTTYPKFNAKDSYYNEKEFKRNMVGALTEIYQKAPDEFEQFKRAVLKSGDLPIDRPSASHFKNIPESQRRSAILSQLQYTRVAPNVSRGVSSSDRRRGAEVGKALSSGMLNTDQEPNPVALFSSRQTGKIQLQANNTSLEFRVNHLVANVFPQSQDPLQTKVALKAIRTILGANTLKFTTEDTNRRKFKQNLIAAIKEKYPEATNGFERFLRAVQSSDNVSKNNPLKKYASDFGGSERSAKKPASVKRTGNVARLVHAQERLQRNTRCH